ncbi:hypothetical protein TNCT_654211 [Trichonephila clavata]|uniref:Uncharacterized protein n=1 Tax=Trichonephila clavata TaxID=2740835 RepID=A0A8X6G8R4_TRICU|nr:hypothetical protein TNCT_654211 [Trichonephila clavata]
MPLGLPNNKFNVFLVTCQDPQPPTGACKTRAAPYCIRKDIRTDFITGKVIDVRHLPSNGNGIHKERTKKNQQGILLSHYSVL